MVVGVTGKAPVVVAVENVVLLELTQKKTFRETLHLESRKSEALMN